MKKLLFTTLVLCVSIFLGINLAYANENASLAMVKIETYALNENFQLEYQGSGSGAIIDSQGIIMTNYHVISANDKLEEHAYLICLSTEQNTKPECRHSADLIAFDEDLDIALLQINNIEDYSDNSSYPALEYYLEDSTSNGQSISVLGYPAIGGGTLSITQGTISGKEDKYSRNWLKTDAVVSYGSSGGVAVDENGKIIGLTSMAYSDTIASLGYIINIDSLINFIVDNKDKSAQTNPLNKRAEKMSIVKIEAKDTDQVYDDHNLFQFIKPSDWGIEITSEGSAGVSHEEDENSGSIIIGYDELPVLANIDIYLNVLKQEMDILGVIMSVVRNEEIELAGLPGRKIRLSFLGESLDLYVLFYQNYAFSVIYDYGLDNQDEEKVNQVLDSLSFNLGDISFLAQREFLKSEPFISFFVNDNWGLLELNNDEGFLTTFSNLDSSTIIDFYLLEIENNKKDYSANEYLNYLKETKQADNLMASMFSVSVSLNEQDLNYYLSPQISDALVLEYVYKNQEDQIVYYTKEYYKKLNDDYYFKILVTNYNDTLEDYQTSLEQAEEVLQGINLGIEEVEKEEEQQEEEPIVQTQVSQISNQAMYDNLKGKILLQVEASGEAYYLHPEKLEMFFLGRPEDAFLVMRQQGIGISDENLLKIPVADTDALELNFENLDSDGDGYGDYQEMINGYNPYGSDKLIYDSSFSGKSAGKIFLQVEKNGEAWYVNPGDNKRYFLGRPADAFAVMRSLGLGISNENLNNLR
jgi:hypothetical protein